MGSEVRVLVIGGSGFTGQRVLAQAPWSWSIAATARSHSSEAVVGSFGAQPLKADLNDMASIRAALAKWTPELVICTASLGFGHAPGLVDALLNTGVPKTVFTSTTGIFTSLNPDSKAVRIEAESAITASELGAAILRPTMIYGRPGDRNMERLLGAARRLPVMPMPGSGRILHQPVHVDDLANAIIAAGRRSLPPRIAINVPGPSPIEFRELLREACRAVGRRGIVIPLPTGAFRAAAVASERLAKAPIVTIEQVERLLEDKSFDASDARDHLGHDPRAFSIGIRDEARALFD
ncbi:MAG: NAD(P)H-binding protein [Sulfitobacter sp.]|nr:NAD(P)H-binding protein [Sulfitobacter sp.]